MATGVLDPGCVFCKIIRGEIPCQRVFENDRLLAFLDIGPLARGHTVIVPKHHCPNLEDLPEAFAAELGQAFGRIARALVSTVSAGGYNVLQNNGSVAGQLVPHVHFHIIPRHADDGLGYRWKAKSASAVELAELAQLIHAAL